MFTFAHLKEVMTVERAEGLDSVGQAFDDNVMHAVIDHLDDGQEFIERLLQVRLAAHHVGGLHQVLGEKLVLGQPLHWLEQIGAERQLVAGLLLTVAEDGRGVLLAPEILHGLSSYRT